ncbi:unnamed protein product [Allacma fusca]|uniref:Uncharacterized protein n=1 Tax=Allacma fusca TaxID=39272 RepID=A0A8J2NWZ1_9HEXA|nr:unnamed protein product [Allacma fusca]
MDKKENQVVAGFTDMSGGTSAPTNPIPAPAPANANFSQEAAADKNKKPPQDLNHLLRLAAELTASHPSPNVGQQMDEERQKFLAEALQNISTANNIVDKIRLTILRLAVGPSMDQEVVEKQLEDLKFISYHVDELDLANDFLKVGGLPEVLKYIGSEDANTRKEAFNILAVVPQNNPFAWSFYQQQNVLPMILDKLIVETQEEVVDTGFSAVSCLIRGNANAILQLKAHNGEDLIYTVLRQSERTKTLRKAGYILRSLMLYDKENRANSTAPRDYYKAILQELCDRIRVKASPRDTLGAVLQVMYYILSEHEELVGNYLKPELGLVEFVKEVLATEPNDEDSLETMETYNAAADLKPLLGIQEE